MRKPTVFVSCAKKDAPLAVGIANTLRAAGFRVFLDEWEIKAGNLLVHKLDKKLLGSVDGVLVLTAYALARSAAQQEYADMVKRCARAKQRMIPVLMAAGTTMLGLIPLFTDGFFVSMAVTIVFGLGFATILTLLIVPVLYAVFYRVPSPRRT